MKRYKRLIRKDKSEAPLPKKAHPLIDTDLARDNLEIDLPASDAHDLDILWDE